MNKKVILGIVMAAIFIASGFAIVVNSSGQNTEVASNVPNVVESMNYSGLTALAVHYNLKQATSSVQTEQIKGSEINTQFIRFNGKSSDQFGLGIIVYINGHVNSELFTLLKINNGLTHAIIFPLISTSMKAPYSFTVNQNTGVGNIHPDGFSRGWIGFAILFNQQQVGELKGLMVAGMGIAGFVAVVAGIPTAGAGTLIAAAVALILSLGLGMIMFADAHGGHRGINIDVLYTLTGGQVCAPEYHVPWGF